MKLYLVDQPIAPNFLLPIIREWKKHKENNIALNSFFLEHESSLAWLKLPKALFKFALRSWGASFDTLIEACKMGSGIISIVGNGGGSEEIKHLKLGSAVCDTLSKSFSNLLIHLDIKWRFCSIIHFPSLAHSSSILLALSSCPWPIGIFINVPFSIDLPIVAPNSSTFLVGSIPGKRTKNIGVKLFVSLNVASISKVVDSIYLSPIFSLM